LLAEPWDVVGDYFADDVGVDVEVGVGEYHSRSDDVAPGDLGVGVLGLVGDSGGGFAEDFDPSLCGRLNDGIGRQKLGISDVLR
jgi:hypothetical protein